MKLHIIKIAWLLAILPLLFACSNEEDYLKPEPPLENGEAVLQIKMAFPKKKSATYAAGDYTATDAEREIKSIAFFTQNWDEGSGTDFKAGAFNRYLSTEDLRTPTGLHEPLNENGGAYTTTIKIRSDGFGKNEVKVLIIANYNENGLTQALKDAATWEEVTALTSLPLTNNPQTPLLMVALEENVPLVNGGTTNRDFHLKRVVSRIDVVNKATASGFALTSAQLVNPREKGYLVEKNPNRDNIALASTDFDPVLPNPSLVTEPAVEGMYAYENTNSDPAKATAVLVKGTYNTIQFEKRIPMKHPDKDGVTGALIPLDPNHRYAINIIPATDPNEITWTIKVADWDDGGEVEVNPPVDSIPKLYSFEFNGTPTDDQWFPDALVYNMDNRGGTKVSFMVTNINTTKYTISYRCLPKYAAAFDMQNKNSSAYLNFVKRDDPVVTYAHVEQRYEVTIPPMLSEPTAPVAIVLSVENAHDRNRKQDIVFFYNKTSYPGTNLPPVLLGGHYWAPVNEGATVIGNAINKSTQGLIYQWGRNTAFNVDWDGLQNNSPSAIAGPISYQEAANSNQFITKSLAPFDWVTSADREFRNKQWLPAINNSPCPSGWRVPTVEELNLIIKRFKVDDTDGRYHIFKGDEKDKVLYLPRVAYLEHGAGKTTSYTGDRALYWGSDFTSGSADVLSSCLNMYYNHPTAPTGLSISRTGRPCYGFSLRCIQQDVEDGRS